MIVSQLTSKHWDQSTHCKWKFFRNTTNTKDFALQCHQRQIGPLQWEELRKQPDFIDTDTSFYTDALHFKFLLLKIVHTFMSRQRCNKFHSKKPTIESFTIFTIPQCVTLLNRAELKTLQSLIICMTVNSPVEGWMFPWICVFLTTDMVHV